MSDHSPTDVKSYTATAMTDLTPVQKLGLLACNAIPIFQIATLGMLVWAAWGNAWTCVGLTVAAVYIVPPLLARLAITLLPIRHERITIGSRDFFVWWFCLNLQMLFCRFPFLEELLRVIPGCYSLWLRLWGAKIGRLTYWAAGTTVVDRQFLHVGDDVTFGAAVRIVPHVFAQDDEGRTYLVLAPVRIGERANIGAHSVLVAGVEIAAGENTRAFLVLPPFNRFESGRRRKPKDPPKVENA